MKNINATINTSNGFIEICDKTCNDDVIFNKIKNLPKFTQV